MTVNYSIIAIIIILYWCGLTIENRNLSCVICGAVRKFANYSRACAQGYNKGGSTYSLNEQAELVVKGVGRASLAQRRQQRWV